MFPTDRAGMGETMASAGGNRRGIRLTVAVLVLIVIANFALFMLRGTGG